MSTPKLNVSLDRLRRDLEHLATIGRTPSGATSRTSFSPADQQVRQWLEDECVEHGLTTDTDGIGNVVIRLADTSNVAEPDTPPVRTGSHLDTVPEGGNYDGILGALAGLEVMRVIAEQRPPLARPIEAVVFADEEGNYHHLLGSTAMVASYEWEELKKFRGRDGDLLVDALAQMGWEPADATRTALREGELHGFVELHIEQGPTLDAAGTDIGVVTGIVGLGGGQAEFRGRSDHAGTTPMDLRLDPIPAAGAFLALLPEIARETSSTAVVTCGLIDVEPGGTNVVPNLARIHLDFRDPDPDVLVALEERLRAAIQEAGREHGIEATYIRESITQPVPLDESIRERISRSASTRGLSAEAIPSGAGHDSQNMARLAPTAMIFIPSTGGSHNPREHAEWDAIENGANILLDTLLDLARS
ncbi:Zn-dependent hydrolase [Ornithinimicrobium sp. Y1694]|uniref:Zn-dependent hydrolase n=1 Tax=Ornithinimicrobium sp. Y1694 TaxID=3418590 RepID=UPI003CE7046E